MDTYKEYWDKCLEEIAQEIGDFPYRTYFESITLVSVENDTIILQVELPFQIEHIRKRYFDTLTKACKKVFGKNHIEISFVLESDIINTPITNVKSSSQLQYNDLNTKHIFENFVVGDSNRLAHAASYAVAEDPGIYNPLFLYGDVGLGKTHLMHAIANFILKENPSSKVLYASCEKFTNELILSIREQRNKEFREKYRKIDVLLIDDIQFISDKTQTQEEFFHTFNDLKNAGKQIIISSDSPPNEIKTITDRLRSRFAGGLVADINPPNFETRTAILEKKAESLNVHIPNKVSQFIAKSIKSNIRELEGALTRVIAYSELTGVDISITLAEDALKDIISESNISLNLDYILNIVANHFNLKVEDLKSKKRNQPITNARQIYMYLSRELLSESLSTIGKIISRDHSTVIHGIEKIEKNIEINQILKNSILLIKDKLSNK